MPSSFLLFCQSGTSAALKLETQGSSSPSSNTPSFDVLGQVLGFKTI